MMTTELNFQKKAMWFEAFAYRSFLSLSDEVVGVGGILHGCVQLRIQLSSKLNEKSTGLFSKPLCLLSGRAFRSLHRLRSLLALLQQHLERPENSGLNGSRTLTSAMPVQCSTGWAIRPTGSRSKCSALNFSVQPLIFRLSRCCLSSAEKCNHHIHLFYWAFQIQILPLLLSPQDTYDPHNELLSVEIHLNCTLVTYEWKRKRE